ncbi:MAG: hypothetical protein JO332_17615 [Planctomycetaceae bacterium]|nr:hypothetical protein [Planctomycetaceae bacterium]
MVPPEILGLVQGEGEGKQAWRFRFVLSDGRRYEERLEGTTLEAWLSAHIRAFETFGGVPPTIELVAAPNDLDEDCLERAWADLIEHYAASPREPGPNGLLPLPVRPYAIPVWKAARLHPDCHVTFAGAYYSAPYRLIGRRLVIRGTEEHVDLYDRDQPVVRHARALRRGERRSVADHYPTPVLARMLPAPRRIRHDARRLGPSITRLVDTILHERPVEGLRGAQGIVHLARRYGILRVEEACLWALKAGQYSYRAVRYALKKGAGHDSNRSA